MGGVVAINEILGLDVEARIGDGAIIRAPGRQVYVAAGDGAAVRAFAGAGSGAGTVAAAAVVALTTIGSGGVARTAAVVDGATTVVEADSVVITSGATSMSAVPASPRITAAIAAAIPGGAQADPPVRIQSLAIGGSGARLGLARRVIATDTIVLTLVAAVTGGAHVTATSSVSVTVANSRRDHRDRRIGWRRRGCPPWVPRSRSTGCPTS